MFQYYTAIIFLIVFSMSIMFIATLTDKVLPRDRRRGFLYTFFLISIVAIAEWFSIYAGETGAELRLINVIGSILIFSIAPVIPYAVASSIIDLKYYLLYRSTLLINFVLQCLSAKFGFIYYVDSSGEYFRGDFYWIYILVYLAMTTLLFASAYKLSRKYQNKNKYILIFIGILLVSGMAVQMIYSNILIVWLTGAITAILMYIYVYSLVSQMDALTTLLNRRCYENQLRNLKKDAAIVLFDVNKFKSVNDTFGHPFGDYCLRHLGKNIKRVYENYGTCYRIGGDEFCVILNKDSSRLENLNKKLIDSITSGQKKEPNLPSVSIGYGYFHADNPDFLKSIDNADEMLYMEKEKLKS